MVEKAIEQQPSKPEYGPDIEINWADHPSNSNRAEQTNKDYLYFDDPYSNKGSTETNDKIPPPSAGGVPSDSTEASAMYQSAYQRAALGLEQGAFQGQVDDLLKQFDGAPPPSLLGLPADASPRAVNQAIQDRMRDNLGLPSDATAQELLERIVEYNNLADLDDVAASRRAEAGLPPSATDAEVDAVNSAYRNASRRASLGMAQIQPEILVDDMARKTDHGDSMKLLGLPQDATSTEITAALDARIKENIGLSRSATRTEMLQRLMKYNEAAAGNASSATDAYSRAGYGLDPSAPLDEVLHAGKARETAYRKIELGLPITASDSDMRAAAESTNEERKENLGLSSNASDEEFRDAIEAGVRRELGLPKDATRVEVMQQLLAYEKMAAINPEGAFTRARLGLSMAAGFEEVQEVMAKRLRPVE